MTGNDFKKSEEDVSGKGEKKKGKKKEKIQKPKREKREKKEEKGESEPYKFIKEIDQELL